MNDRLRADDSDDSLYVFGNMLLRGRRWISLFVLIFMITTLFVQLRKHRSWESSGSFTPETGRGGSQITNLAAQFGLNVNSPSPQSNPQFYADLAKSRDILRDMLAAKFVISDDKGTRTADLLTIMDPAGKTPAEREAAGLKALEESVNPSVAIRTGIVTVSVGGPTAPVAKAMVDTLLAAINRFNIERRQSQARAEREFLSARVDETQRALRAVQDSMQYFLASNRDYLHSTVLTFQHDRMQATVVRYERVFDGLTQALEQARIDEIRDTPVITILQHPDIPLIPNSRGTVMRLLIAMVMGTIVGLFIALFTQFGKDNGEHTDPRLSFRRGITELIADVRRGHLLRAAFGGAPASKVAP